MGGRDEHRRARASLQLAPAQSSSSLLSHQAWPSLRCTTTTSAREASLSTDRTFAGAAVADVHTLVIDVAWDGKVERVIAAPAACAVAPKLIDTQRMDTDSRISTPIEGTQQHGREHKLASHRASGQPAAIRSSVRPPTRTSSRMAVAASADRRPSGQTGSCSGGHPVFAMLTTPASRRLLSGVVYLSSDSTALTAEHNDVSHTPTGRSGSLR